MSERKTILLKYINRQRSACAVAQWLATFRHKIRRRIRLSPLVSQVRPGKSPHPSPNKIYSNGRDFEIGPLTSVTGPRLPTCALQQVGSYLGYTGHPIKSRHGSPWPPAVH